MWRLRGSGYFAKLPDLIKSQHLLRSFSWMLAAEGVSKASRLVTIVVLGLCLTPAEYGVAMLAIVCHELLRVFTRTGIGAKIIQCDSVQLYDLAANAITLQWLICLTLAALQVASADVIAHYYNAPDIAGLLKIMALSHLLYPLVAIRVFLVQRRNNMRFLAQATALSVTVENLATALLALAGLGVVSVALAKLLSALCWVVIFRRQSTLSLRAEFSLAPLKQLTQFSTKVMSSELLKSLRANADSLFAARLLSPEMFGLYSFSKGAGVGLSISLSNGFLASLYPYLCEQQRLSRLNQGIRKTYLVGAGVCAIFAIQAMAAPLYVDLLFDSRWQDSALLISILCLSAIPALLLDTSNTILRARNLAHREVYSSLFSLLPLLVCFWIVAPQTPLACALVVTLTSLIWIPLAWIIGAQWRLKAKGATPIPTSAIVMPHENRQTERS